MALHRKVDALLALRPDIAVIGECAEPATLQQRGGEALLGTAAVWMGTSRHKGLGVFAFNGYRLSRHELFHPTLRFILPVRVSGPRDFNLMAVWAQNASGGVTRKHQPGPLRRALVKYRDFLASDDTVIGGDLNSNAIWDKPGWRINHMTKVELLDGLGLASVYHVLRNEAHGHETTPTHYWRDRREDGPTYHLDYIFAPKTWIATVSDFRVGSFGEWVGNGLSDHTPLVVEFAEEPPA